MKKNSGGWISLRGQMAATESHKFDNYLLFIFFYFLLFLFSFGGMSPKFPQEQKRVSPRHLPPPSAPPTCRLKTRSEFVKLLPLLLLLLLLLPPASDTSFPFLSTTAPEGELLLLLFLHLSQCFLFAHSLCLLGGSFGRESPFRGALRLLTDTILQYRRGDENYEEEGPRGGYQKAEDEIPFSQTTDNVSFGGCG